MPSHDDETNPKLKIVELALPNLAKAFAALGDIPLPPPMPRRPEPDAELTVTFEAMLESCVGPEDVEYWVKHALNEWLLGFEPCAGCHRERRACNCP